MPSSGSYWLNYRINIIMQYDDPLSDSMWHPQRHGGVFAAPDSPVLFFLPYSSSQHQVPYITCFNRASHFSLAHFALSQNGWIYQNFKKCQSKFGVFCFNSDRTWGSLVFLYLQDVLGLFRLLYDFFSLHLTFPKQVTAFYDPWTPKQDMCYTWKAEKTPFMWYHMERISNSKVIKQF